MAEIPAEAVRLAAEAIEEVAIRRLGRDLGTTSRDEIVEAGLRAALPLLVQAGREAALREAAAKFGRDGDLDGSELLLSWADEAANGIEEGSDG